MSEAVDGEVMEEGWWHPVQCSNVHNESGNCIDVDGAIVGWRERRLTRVADPREVAGSDFASELGWTTNQATAMITEGEEYMTVAGEVRYKLASWTEDWNDPAMDVYDAGGVGR